MLKKVLAACALFCTTSMAMSAPVGLGESLYVQQTGNVTLTYTGKDASYTDLLLLLSPSNSFGIIFNNQATNVGSVFNLGSFAAGTQLIFGLYAVNENKTYYSGNAASNPDHIAHAAINFDVVNHLAYVGFEDLYNGGDKDYNDFKFSLSNVGSTPAHVPEPASWALMAAGAGLLTRVRTRRAKSVLR